MTRQQYVRGPRGLLLPLRRDCPEILLPESGDSIGVSSGTSGAFSAWAQTVTPAQFGTKELVIAGVAVMAMFNQSVAADGNPSAGVGFQIAWELYHGTTDPATEADRIRQIIAEGNATGKLQYVFAGNTDNTTDVQIISPCTVLRKIAPRRIGPSARIAIRAASNTVNAVATNAMPIAYDLDKLNWHVPLVPDEALCLGYADVQSDRSEYLTLTTPAAGAWANSAYADFTVNGQAELDADYYVYEALFGQDPTVTQRSANLDIAVLPKGGTAEQDEAIQSRAALIRNSSAPHTNAWEFPMGPFVAYKGEKIRGRVRRGVAGAVTHVCMLNLARIAPY